MQSSSFVEGSETERQGIGFIRRVVLSQDGEDVSGGLYRGRWSDERKKSLLDRIWAQRASRD